MSTKRRPKLKWLLAGLAAVVVAVVAVVLLTGGSSKKTLPSGGTLTAGKQQLLPLSPSGRLAGKPGQKVVGKNVHVRSVVNKTGFWVGGSDVDRVFVHSPSAGKTVAPTVDLSGTIKPAPTNVQKTFGLPARDTAKVTAEGAYIEANP